MVKGETALYLKRFLKNFDIKEVFNKIMSSMP
jgi:hypothetical protein